MGLWRVMPVTFLVYLVGAASITAVPGFNGFISKGMVIDSAHEIHNFELLFGEGLLWWLLILGGVGTFMSFIKLGYYMFFHGSRDAVTEGRNAVPDRRDGAGGRRVRLLRHAVHLRLPVVLMPFTAEVAPELHPYSTSHLTESAALLVAGFVGFFALKRPLGWLAHHMRDVDAVTYPAAFYLARGSVWGVTELWAAVDRAVMNAIAAGRRVDRDAPAGGARARGRRRRDPNRYRPERPLPDARRGSRAVRVRARLARHEFISDRRPRRRRPRSVGSERIYKGGFDRTREFLFPER